MFNYMKPYVDSDRRKCHPENPLSKIHGMLFCTRVISGEEKETRAFNWISTGLSTSIYNTVPSPPSSPRLLMLVSSWQWCIQTHLPRIQGFNFISLFSDCSHHLPESPDRFDTVSYPSGAGHTKVSLTPLRVLYYIHRFNKWRRPLYFDVRFLRAHGN